MQYNWATFFASSSLRTQVIPCLVFVVTFKKRSDHSQFMLWRTGEILAWTSWVGRVVCWVSDGKPSTRRSESTSTQQTCRVRLHSRKPCDISWEEKKASWQYTDKTWECQWQEVLKELHTLIKALSSGSNWTHATSSTCTMRSSSNNSWKKWHAKIIAKKQRGANNFSKSSCL